MARIKGFHGERQGRALSLRRRCRRKTNSKVPNSYSKNVSIDLNCFASISQMNAFDPFIILNIGAMCSNIAINFVQTNANQTEIRNMRCEIAKSKNPSNSEINNINKILVMNADAYIIRMARHRTNL